MTLEDWNTVFQFGSAILLGLTFVFGVGAIITAHVLNKRLEARIAATGLTAAEAHERAGRLEVEAATQRERAATAEKQLLGLQRRLQPRRVPPSLIEFLRGKATGTVEFFFKDEDNEAHMFAIGLQAALKAAGWNVRAPEPLKGSGKVLPSWPGAPLSPSGGGYGGDVMVLTRVIEPEPYLGDTPFSALAGALLTTEFGLAAHADKSLPANSFRIIVGAKP